MAQRVTSLQLSVGTWKTLDGCVMVRRQWDVTFLMVSWLTQNIFMSNIENKMVQFQSEISIITKFIPKRIPPDKYFSSTKLHPTFYSIVFQVFMRTSKYKDILNNNYMRQWKRQIYFSLKYLSIWRYHVAHFDCCNPKKPSVNVDIVIEQNIDYNL